MVACPFHCTAQPDTHLSRGYAPTSPVPPPNSRVLPPENPKGKVQTPCQTTSAYLVHTPRLCTGCLWPPSLLMQTHPCTEGTSSLGTSA